MTYLAHISGMVDAWLAQKFTNDPLSIAAAEIVTICDDKNPEGGVLVTVRFQLGVDFCYPENFPVWLAAKLQLWSEPPEVSFVGERKVLATFGFIPSLDLREFLNLIDAVIAQKGIPYQDEVIAINFSQDFLEVTRQSNRNPTTMVAGHGTGECIRHHGEHVYLNKHLLKLVLGA